jgi:glycine betaine/proline transport system substrate-binding protein
MHSVVDLTRLKEPPFTGYKRENMKHHPDYNPDGCFEMYYSNETKDWLKNSTITCSSPEITVHVAYSQSLKKRFPEISNFLKRFSPTIHIVNDWVYQIGYLNIDSKEMANSWVRDNQEIVDNWLQEYDVQ